MSIDGSSLFITGGTGSFGRKFVETVLNRHKLKRIIVFSRDEQKQYEMRQQGFTDPRLRYFIGDIRDKDRLLSAMHNVDIVIHAAALKHIESCEYNPFEVVQTNIMGTRNVIEAAQKSGIQKVLALSTDKAVHPISLYGATKLVAEKLIVQGNVYGGSVGPRLSCVRYGNVIGSRGSVIPLFLRQRHSGILTVTDKRMTRFWITLEQGVDFVLQCIEHMQGGEIFVPKLPSMRLMDLAKAIAPDCKIILNGKQPNEKIHEVLISAEEAQHTIDAGHLFIIIPKFPFFFARKWPEGTRLPEETQYSSNRNSRWLSIQELQDSIFLSRTPPHTQQKIHISAMDFPDPALALVQDDDTSH